jgi:opacity protein-like surface antigen
MRKHLLLTLALLLVLVSAVSAADKSAASSKQYHRTHGDIASIDATAQTFTVKHGNDTSTFKTDASTKFRGAGKEITFADLQVGDDARVSFTEDGTDKTAARVDVVHAKKKM